MDINWNKSDFLKYIRRVDLPAFIVDRKRDDWIEQISGFIRENWNQYVQILHAGDPESAGQDAPGYQRLVTMENRLESRRETIRERLSRWRDRSVYLKLVIRAYMDKIRSLAEEGTLEKASKKPSQEEIGNAFRSLLDLPIGGNWGKHTEKLRPKRHDLSGWVTSPLATNEPGQRSPNFEPGRQRITYIPSSDDLEDHEIDRENVSTMEKLYFDVDSTWRQSMDKLEERLETVKEEQTRHSRTVKLVEFRLGILDNVLYQLETFGSVSRLTKEEAEELTEATPTADDIMQEFGETGIEECENWEEKNDLKEWALEEVGSSYSNTVRRLKEIDVWVTGRQGVPGSRLTETIQNMKQHIAAD